MKKYLYTDIDGVLSLGSEVNPKNTKWGFVHRFNKKAVEIYNEILEKTNADIIITSDWKFHFTLEQLQEIFIEWAGIIKKPIDLTPYISGGSLQQLEEYRAKEILQHIEQYKPDNWVAIDDLKLTPWLQEENFIYLPRFMEGVKQSSKKEEIIKKLNL